MAASAVKGEGVREGSLEELKRIFKGTTDVSKCRNGEETPGRGNYNLPFSMFLPKLLTPHIERHVVFSGF